MDRENHRRLLYPVTREKACRVLSRLSRFCRSLVASPAHALPLPPCRIDRRANRILHTQATPRCHTSNFLSHDVATLFHSVASQASMRDPSDQKWLFQPGQGRLLVIHKSVLALFAADCSHNARKGVRETHQLYDSGCARKPEVSPSLLILQDITPSPFVQLDNI